MAINRGRPIGLPKTGVSEPLSIVYRDIEELKADPENPRLHSEKQIQQIARSIEAGQAAVHGESGQSFGESAEGSHGRQP
jgi:hypothetical protein